MTWILKYLRGDKMIWLVVTLLALFSLPVIYTGASHPMLSRHNSEEFYLLKHFLLLLMGFTAMIVIHRFDYRIFARISKALLFLTIPVLVYTMFFGKEINGASRWINLGFFSFQPSDMGKVTLMIYLAKVLTERQNVLEDFQRGFLPVIGWVCAICVLIAPSNLSTAMLIFAASMVLIFIGGAPFKYLGAFLGIGLVVGALVFFASPRRSTWEHRVKAYWTTLTNPEVEPEYQVREAQLAIYNGGATGLGAGKSTEANWLPQSTSDMVFPVIVEEYGSVIGAFIVMLLYLFLFFRTVAIVTISKTFGALLAVGLSFILTLQALINMAVPVGLLPVTGQPLPLLSMGGTSVVFTCISLGIILSVSRTAIDEKNKEKGLKEAVA
jgi:cell division protein FtsW